MSQVHIDVNHDNIRGDLAIQIATLSSDKAILTEQVRVLANDKVILEAKVRELEERVQGYETPQDAPPETPAT